MMKLNLQFFAHKKGVGSTKNGRDSEAKRLGAKRADAFVLNINATLAGDDDDGVFSISLTDENANYSLKTVGYNHTVCVG